MASEFEREIERGIEAYADKQRERKRRDEAIDNVDSYFKKKHAEICSDPDVDIGKLEDDLSGFCRKTPRVSGGEAYWRSRLYCSEIWFALGKSKRERAEKLMSQGRLEEAENVLCKASHFSTTPDFQQALYKASYPSGIPDSYVSYSGRKEREEEIRNEEDRCRTIKRDLQFEAAKRKVGIGDAKSALADLETLGLIYAKKALVDSAFDEIREDCNLLVKKLEMQAAAAKDARKTEAAAEKRRYGKSMVLQIAATLAVFTTHFLWGPEAAPDANFGMTVLFAGLPVLMAAILMGIIEACLNAHLGKKCGVVFVAVPVYTIVMAVIMANGFWGFIGYIIMLGIVNIVFTTPSFLVFGYKSGRKLYPSLQITVPVVIFATCFLFLYLAASTLEGEHVYELMDDTIVLAIVMGAPVLIASIAIGIIELLLAKSETNLFGSYFLGIFTILVMIVPVNAASWALFAANGFWGFIGYFLILGIVSAAFSLPGLIISGIAKKRNLSLVGDGSFVSLK